MYAKEDRSQFTLSVYSVLFKKKRKDKFFNDKSKENSDVNWYTFINS